MLRRRLLACSATAFLHCRRVLRAVDVVVLDPDRLPALSRDDKARSAPLFILTPYWHIGFRPHLAHELARHEACANLRCSGLVQPLRDSLLPRRLPLLPSRERSAEGQ